MRAEEQLKLAYITIADLKNQNEKLVNAIASLERRLAESDGRDRRIVEEFYRGMIEDMRLAQEKEIASLKAAREKELESLRSVVKDLTAQISALAASGKVNTGKLYGRKSEKSSRLNKRRDDDDRNQGKDNFDGTAGSDKGRNTGSAADASQGKTSSGDTVSALQKKILRTHPGVEMRVERIDYSKAAAYTDSPIYHRLEEYYELPKGAYFVTRNGEVDKNCVKVILYYPARIEEHIYETATVRFRDEDDVRTLDTITIDRPIEGCCFGAETLSYILMEKFWYNTPFEQIVRKLRALGLRMSKSTLGDNVHRAIEYMRGKMKEWWERAMLAARYWMIDETPGLVGCENENGERAYMKKYFWSITARVLKLSCLVHIRRLFVNALEENFDEAMWFIERMGLIFAKEHCFKEQKLTNNERYLARLKPGSTADLMKSIEERLADNAFMYSVIESCKLNDIDPGKYISYLLGKLKTAKEGEDLTGLLPCYCGL